MTIEADNARPVPRVPRGFRDLEAADVIARRKMLATISEVYERFGFEPLETPAIEYLDALGKFLPESDTPAGGVFSLRDDDSRWIALRYDLTAPLSRYYALNANRLTSPYRRYQIGPVWRQEKPGPGRFKEFYQCDFDTVGTESMVADAEICAVVATCFEALGIGRGDYILRLNNRKVLNGVLDAIALPEDSDSRLSVLRAIDKLDRLGTKGVRQLLGKGRLDDSGDFTEGAGLGSEQIEIVAGYLEATADDRAGVCARLRELVGASEVGAEGIRELEEIHQLLDAMDLGQEQVIFDPSVVRGLAYYTGPVVEAVLTIDVEEEGEKKEVGSVLGGGRYDDLVERFTGTRIPATGGSIGVDRLLAALELVAAGDHRHRRVAPVGVLELGAEAAAAEIELGGGAGRAPLGRHPLIVAAPAVVHHRRHHRALGAHRVEAVELLERRQQAVDADAGAGGWHVGAGEALDEVVVAAAAEHRAEGSTLPVFLDLEGELGLEHRPGVIGQPADDAGVEDHLVLLQVHGVEELTDALELADALLAGRALADELAQEPADVGAVGGGGPEVAHDDRRLLVGEAGALGVIARVVEAALAEKLADAAGTDAVELVDGPQDGQPGARAGRLVVVG